METPLAGKEDWEPIPVPKSIGLGRSFVSGDPDGDGLRLRYFRRKSDGAFMARVWFGPNAEGPPLCAHGGSMAAMLDEAMGSAAWIAGHTVVAARLTLEFKEMLPLGREVTVEAWVESVHGRKVATEGRIVSDDGTVHAIGEGLFIQVNLERFADLGDLAQKKWGAMSEKKSLGAE
ncbi:MAG: PaaI family thioesterase [Deltaproteobacteria bacterium]|nr:PaaI family thioesterase [bacterium]MCB9477309.1 PaaI family thioesterase [Deltaproteobacteria bacterium]MCB9478775.1 PaaI family thioesterase [Deltaproteobacteria bacterium]MCB9488291.1 PaaI family thioesterase [Deltaproteobacteria bacterium]